MERGRNSVGGILVHSHDNDREQGGRGLGLGLGLAASNTFFQVTTGLLLFPEFPKDLHMTNADQCCFLKKYFPPKMAEIGVSDSNRAKLCKNLMITLVFEKKRHFLRRKLSKIAEICYHNIDPRSQSYDF
jgi:hypothetical protein